MKTTLLTTCTSATEAEQIQKKLKLAGLKCKLHKVNHKEDANLHEIEVLVAESDYQRALEAMNAPEVQEVSVAPQTASQKAMSIEELLTRAVFYFIGLPAVLFPAPYLHGSHSELAVLSGTRILLCALHD